MSSLHHVALGARDVERVATFYEQALGLNLVARHVEPSGATRSIWLELGDALLMIERTEQRPQRVEGVGAGPFLIAVRVEKEARRSWEARLEQHGGRIESRTDFTSYARDPEGNRVAVSHYPR